MHKYFANILKITRLSCVQFYKDECLDRAASLAYTSLLALVPLLTVSLFVLTTIPAFGEISKIIQEFIFANFVIESAQTVQQYFQQFIEQAHNLSVVGSLVLLITAVLLVISMEHHFNFIWHVPKGRHGRLSFFMYAGIIMIVPLLIGIGIAVTSYLMSIPIFGMPLIKKDIMLAAPYIVTFASLALLYLTLPNCKVPYGAAFIATFIASILFEIVKRAFTFYITAFANFKIIYGALAAVPIFFLWLYVSWVIILFGVVVNHVIAQHKNFSV